MYISTNIVVIICPLLIDFVYFDIYEKKTIVEDVKGVKTQVYKIKKKLFEFIYPNLTIKEIY